MLCIRWPALFVLLSMLAPGAQAQSNPELERFSRILAAQQAEINSLKKNATPVGTVVAFAGAQAPEGWKLCDGSALSINEYPELYKVLGPIYSTQTDTTTEKPYAAPAEGTFRIPDYRNTFLRGVGAAAALGQWNDDATAVNSLAASSVSVSEVIDPGHSHTPDADTGYWRHAGTGAGLNGPGLNNTSPHRLIINPSLSNVSVNTTTRTTLSSRDPETQPKNRGVNYIIRVRP